VNCEDMWNGREEVRRVLVIHFADCCILNTTKETKVGEESTEVKTDYETSVVRGEEMFKLWRADRPKVTKSCGRNCSGTVSMRCLLTTGSKCDGWFSLSSDG